MNPFDLPGPDFLVFYFVVSVIVIFVAWRMRRNRELQDVQRVRFAQINDPYLIACLRGGEAEVMRVAILSLVDRNLLGVTDDHELVTTELGRRTEPRKAIEKRLLEKCLVPKPTSELLASEVAGAAWDYTNRLEKERFLPTDDIRIYRRTLFASCALVLGGIAAVKILIALSRGRTNVLFLIVMSLFSLVVLGGVVSPRLTAAGKRQLAEIRNMFQSLKLRAAQIRPGGSTAELALLAGVYGVGAVSGSGYDWTKKVFPAASSSSSSSCGSSCGSSSGSSCGGGGCGGGCGGCGG